METDAEKRNLGLIATPSLVGAPNRRLTYSLVSTLAAYGGLDTLWHVANGMINRSHVTIQNKWREKVCSN